MSAMESKEDFIKSLGDNIIKGYKRKKLKDLPTVTTESEITTVEPTDMELDDEENPNESLTNVQFTRPPPPAEPVINSEDVPPPPPPCENQTNLTNNLLSESLLEKQSLEDLEALQQKLLQGLQGNTSINTTIDQEDSLIDEVMALEAMVEQETAITIITNSTAIDNKDTNKTSDTTQKATAAQCSIETADTENQNQANEIISTAKPKVIFKETLMGTPLLQFSPFDKLPAGDNFKVGVSDVINFENLPDSTGKYEQMKGLIKKVRTIVTKLHNEDD